MLHVVSVVGFLQRADSPEGVRDIRETSASQKSICLGVSRQIYFILTQRWSQFVDCFHLDNLGFAEDVWKLQFGTSHFPGECHSGV